MGEAHEAHHSPLLSLTPEAFVAAVGNGFELGRSQTAHIRKVGHNLNVLKRT